MTLRTLGFASVALLVACSASQEATFQPSATSGAGGELTSSGSSLDATTSTASGDTGGFSPSGSTSSGGGDDCSEASKLIYVVGTGNELYSFAPQTLAFTKIGIINCAAQGTSGQPFSMAVSRDGTAYVLYDDGKIFAVDTATAACTKTNFVPDQYPSFHLFGMGFASDTANSTSETLYVASYEGVGLGRITFPSMKLDFVGAYNQIGEPGELTGTGDGRLFGFFLSFPVTVAEIDKANAKILSVAPQPSVNIGGGWAFAFWGGDFWLFTSPNSVTSQVDRYQPALKKTTTVAQIPFKIVGAGVSTCAPVEQPK